MSVVTRFAPSPTGYLHIGGARTALFNWLFSRHHGGSFRLRIEDTDRQRSTPEAIEAILHGLQWLGLEWDDEVVYQSQRAERHAEVARRLLDEGKAYYCYATQQELEEMRAQQRAEGKPTRYDGRWRDRDPSEAPEGIPPVVRIKAPQEGETVIHDLVQGEVKVQNAQLDDMVLLRADGSPTYMLSVVVDDQDMEITHAIRGDDHLTNAFRQTQLYRACGWEPPVFAHIPLIHGPDGAKLSKRHGALGVEAYEEMGYLPEAMRNYLLRLGWGHGDDEIISTAQAVEWFDLDAVGRSPARFDFQKLDNLNGHYLREADDRRLAEDCAPRIAAAIGRELQEAEIALLTKAMDGLKQRAKTLREITDNSIFFFHRPTTLTAKAAKNLDEAGRRTLAALLSDLEGLTTWDEAACEEAVRRFAEAEGVKLGQVAQPLRGALTGSHMSPGIFEVMALLGREECLSRLREVPTAVAEG